MARRRMTRQGMAEITARAEQAQERAGRGATGPGGGDEWQRHLSPAERASLALMENAMGHGDRAYAEYVAIRNRAKARARRAEGRAGPETATDEAVGQGTGGAVIGGPARPSPALDAFGKATAAKASDYASRAVLAQDLEVQAMDFLAKQRAFMPSGWVRLLSGTCDVVFPPTNTPQQDSDILRTSLKAAYPDLAEFF